MASDAMFQKVIRRRMIRWYAVCNRKVYNIVQKAGNFNSIPRPRSQRTGVNATLRKKVILEHRTSSISRRN